MKIKIGDTWYNADDQPIMIVLADQDKKNIADMPPELSKYCLYTLGLDPEFIKKWMAGDALWEEQTTS